MRGGMKDEYVKYTRSKQVRLTDRLARLIKTKAVERNTSESEIIRQAVAHYINRNMSDSEIVHASLAENSRKLRYLENKVELLALVVFQQVRFLLRVMPGRQVNSERLVDLEFGRFRKECMESFKDNRGRMLESMILDLYEQGDREGE